jgi:hypothetical protein
MDISIMIQISEIWFKYDKQEINVCRRKKKEKNVLP